MRRIVRVVALVLVIIMAAAMVGCKKEEVQMKLPENVSEPLFNYGMKAIEIADDVCDFKITESEALEKIKALMKTEDALPEHEQGSRDNAMDSIIKNYVAMIYAALSSKPETVTEITGKSVTEEITAARNVIAKVLGLKER